MEKANRHTSQKEVKRHSNEQAFDTMPNTNSREALFLGTLSRCLIKSKRFGYHTAILVIDLVDNTTLGAATNMGSLTYLIEELRQHLTTDDEVFELSDSRVGVIIKQLSKTIHITTLAKKLSLANDELAKSRGRSSSPKLSFGFAFYPFDGENETELFNNALKSILHISKEQTEVIQFYSETPEIKEHRSKQLSQELERALVNNEFYLSYQPVINLKTHEIAGIEALIRWQHPKYGSIAPVAFIPEAKALNLIVPIGEWVIENACKQFQQWLSAGLNPGDLFINTAAQQLNDPDFIDTMINTLEKYNIPKNTIFIEVTDIEQLEDFESAHDTLSQLQAHGIQISIDDFGHGNTSLEYFETLPANVLKVDQHFINSITKLGPSDHTIVSILKLASVFGISVIAEGIEKHEQLNWLLDNDCFLGQGYILCSPLNAEAMTRYLQK